jgi:hypothetical protein
MQIQNSKTLRNVIGRTWTYLNWNQWSRNFDKHW